MLVGLHRQTSAPVHAGDSKGQHVLHLHRRRCGEGRQPAAGHGTPGEPQQGTGSQLLHACMQCDGANNVTVRAAIAEASVANTLEYIADIGIRVQGRQLYMYCK